MSEQITKLADFLCVGHGSLQRAATSLWVAVLVAGSFCGVGLIRAIGSQLSHLVGEVFFKEFQETAMSAML